MSSLHFWAIAGAVVTLLVTVWFALKDAYTGGQSVLDSLLEAWTNIAIGFGINWVANLIVLPLAGFDVTWGDAFYIGLVFTGISIVRSFLIRRWYNRIMIKKMNRRKA